MHEVSIIIPVYNVQEYLTDCLNSLCEQVDVYMQIICIDDGSTDSSYSILQQYANRMEHLEIYKNKNNCGQASARNTGMRYAKGEYILFLDSDDYLASGSVKRLYETAQNHNADVLTCSAETFTGEPYEGSVDSQWRVRKHKYSDDCGINMMTQFIENNEMYGSVWGALYRREFLEENKISFIPDILHEDVPFIFEALLKADKVCCINDIAYYYRQRKDSTMHRINYAKRLEGSVIGYRKMLELWKVYEELYPARVKEAIGKYLKDKQKFAEDMYINALAFEQPINRETEKYFLESEYGFEQERLENLFALEDIDRIFESKKIMVYGAGQISRIVLYLLRKKGISVSGIYVSNLQNNPHTLFGLPVKKWNVEKMDAQELLVVAVSKQNQKDIIGKLDEDNFSNYVLINE